MLSVHAVISGFGILISECGKYVQKIDSLAENLVKAVCLLALLDAADWDQGVLCLHQVVLEGAGGGRKRKRERKWTN